MFFNPQTRSRCIHSCEEPKKKVDWPLFPGYCFARFDASRRLTVLKCPGVVSVVSFDGVLAQIPEQEIAAIRQLVESDLQYDPCPFIHEGIGRLVRKGAHARLVLSVDLIGQAVSVDVEAADVRPY